MNKPTWFVDISWESKKCFVEIDFYPIGTGFPEKVIPVIRKIIRT